MLTAAVIHLEAAEDGVLESGTGRAVHGFWFHRWQAVDPAFATELHDHSGTQPFTLSSLMDLPRPRRGEVTVPEGTTAWFRVTTLTAALSARLTGAWLPGLPATVTIAGLRWRVLGHVTDRDAHPWAGCATPQDLAAAHLLAARPPRAWRFTFATPTAFHGTAGHLPFPLPGPLVGSWLRRWQAFGPVLLPEDQAEAVQAGLAVSAYRLKTVPLRERGRVTIGCVGWLKLYATRLDAPTRAVVDLLAAYAFWVGSGHRTTQGMGMTGLRGGAR
jgi:CRISPR-associated endoribonuclease Cas6